MVAGKTQIAAAVAVAALAGSAYAAPTREPQQLAARMDKIIRVAGQVAKDTLHGKVVDAANDKLKDTFGSKPQPLTPQQQAAIDRAAGPHHPSTVASALGHLPKTPQPGHKKRSLEDALDEIIARAYYGEDADELVARMDKVVKIVGQVAKDTLHGKVVDAAHNKIKDTFGPKPQPLTPQQQQGIDRAKGPHHPGAVDAALGHLPKSHKKREYDLDDALVARMDKVVKVIGQVAKDTLHGKVVDAAHDKLKDTFVSKPAPLTPQQQAAIDRASGPHHPSTVASALGHLPKTPQPSHKKRAIEDALDEIIARAYFGEDVDELVARMDKVVKIVGQVAKDTLHGKVVDAANNKIKDTFGSKPQPLTPQQQQAIDRAKGPHHPGAVDAALGHLPKSHKKRDFDLDDALLARMDKVVKVIGQVAKDTLHGKVVDAANDKLKDTFGSKPQPLTPQQQQAIGRASGPHHPSTVASALGHLPKTPQSGHKKRYLEDEVYEIFARGFELDDLE